MNNFIGTTTITTEEYIGLRSDIEYLQGIIDSFSQDDKVIIIDTRYNRHEAIQTRYQTENKEGIITSITKDINRLNERLDKKNEAIVYLEEAISLQQKTISDFQNETLSQFLKRKIFNK